jgi:uncharacterized membrane protein
MVLRTIRGGDDNFVPQYAVIVAMLLAVCSIGVLIYFVHHVPQSIHINNVVAHIGEQLVRDTKSRYPAMIGTEAKGSPPRFPPPSLRNSMRIPAAAIGYIQCIDEERLLGLASKADVLIQLRYRPGDFVVVGRKLADVAPVEHWSDDCSQEL